MLCSNFKRKINDYTSGRLAESDTVEFLDHASRCPECQRLLAEEERLSHLLKSLPIPPLPAGLNSRILTSLPRQTRHVTLSRPVWWMNATRSFRAAAVIVLMVGLTLGTLIGRSLHRASPMVEVNAAAYYGLDQFSEAPDGTLTAAYLSLVTPDAAEGR